MSNEAFDLLVVGAGMAGLTAGAKAASSGKKVCLLEIGGDVGGSARFAGYAWTAPTHEVMDAENPLGDEALKRALVDRFPAGVDWIRSVGIDVDDAQRILSFGDRATSSTPTTTSTPAVGSSSMPVVRSCSVRRPTVLSGSMAS